ncbi:MAG TPA: zf-HC2 domain-containing protein [Blastocatellia bacterium]|nr:zf-HC2 domain-containing protein [Blastocatellia bacterium]
MDCSRFEEVLSDYLDGLLAKGEASRCAAHALQCRACRGLLEDVRAALNECRQGAEVETPLELEMTLARIPAEHTPLACADFEELISDFLDGFVPAHAYSRFEAHAAACNHCSVLLTDVVYAVAACHSVHTYEEVDVPDALLDSLLAVMPAKPRSIAAVVADRVAAFAAALMPRATQGAQWSFATAVALIVMTFALLVGFSDDMTPSGIYRQARMRAAEIYSEGTDIYAQKEEVVAGLRQVGEDIGEIWETLGGTEANTATDQPAAKQ